MLLTDLGRGKSKYRALECTTGAIKDQGLFGALSMAGATKLCTGRVRACFDGKPREGTHTRSQRECGQEKHWFVLTRPNWPTKVKLMIVSSNVVLGPSLKVDLGMEAGGMSTC